MALQMKDMVRSSF